MVACCATKANGPRPVRELYVSDWFAKARAHDENTADRWFVLSARCGLLAPDCVVAPYEESLLRMSPDARRQWGARVLRQLDEQGCLGFRTCVVLAGVAYREALLDGLSHRFARVDVPLAGMGIITQMARFNHEQAKRSGQTMLALHS